MTVIIFWGYRHPPSPLSSPITHPHMRENRDKTAYRWRPFANRDHRSSTFTLSVIILSFVNQNYLKWKLRIVFLSSHHVIICHLLLGQKSTFNKLNTEFVHLYCVKIRLFFIREKIRGAKNKGEECSLETRIIDLAETHSCNTLSCPPGIFWRKKIALSPHFSWLWCWRVGCLD